MKIANDCAVAFDFVMTGPDGTVLDTSQGKPPFEYLHGYNQVVPGLEQALEGRMAGEEFSVTLAPEQAYGPRDENRQLALPRDEFEDDELVIGNRVYVMGERGPRLASILHFDEEKVVLDTNHELAGITLNYNVKILGVRSATFSELGCGHIHDPIAIEESGRLNHAIR